MLTEPTSPAKHLALNIAEVAVKAEEIIEAKLKKTL